ncbi:hypothetical protein [Phenylobacterium sp.]|uniref:hypothetical protein n=1 Tax=Phenylobacterium sp. TaxID=1871053 RepID=UPI00289C5218|nr:hypothetical protein [Phenylobacterium sp.]
MKTTLLIAASAMALTACTRDASHAVTRLDCPGKEGDLTRVSSAPDGKTCVYRSPDGAQVSLELTPVVDSAQATLARIETDLRSTPGPMTPDAEAAQAEVSATIAEAAALKANVGAIAAEVARVHAEAAADAGISPSSKGSGASDGGSNRIDLPGVHVSEEGDSANVRIGPLRVDANGDDTTVNIYRDVRMKGEAFSTQKRGVRATFIYTGKDLPAGYRYVGYEAGGPKTGPLTVAKVRSKLNTESGDKIYHDVQELVRRNGGV